MTKEEKTGRLRVQVELMRDLLEYQNRELYKIMRRKPLKLPDFIYENY